MIKQSSNSNQLDRREHDETSEAKKVKLVASSLTSSPPVDGRTKVAIVRHNYQSTNVTTTAYVTLIASTSEQINELQIFDSSGKTLVIAVGGVGSEVDQIYVFPGGNGNTNLKIAALSRVSVKAISGDAVKGELTINFLK